MARVRRNRKLVLEQAARVPDAAGGWRESWVALGTLWAEMTAGSGRAAGGEAAHVSAIGYRITVRAAPFGAPSRPKPGQRFCDGARLFTITAVAERGGSGRYLTCFAEEEVAL